ncbi:YhcN/YlaJ family sporulation lipoprotein [Wansuia hejianensis]|uniref:YhcN/YlaJ family sporulation lipoprotein n=1 Tax=Wansuia hejianensis TaxID=2763667 RepID=A0A926F2B9_9FIRM|nr:YhcN/YlaJ family sporulation lipoprotein [Wansuia hejianensis]MBC8590659.1 YhcN/YlaJ family sporulation lipoprotein [Wansuia hejianensis]
MKAKKFNLIVLGLILVLVLGACTPNDTNVNDRNRNLSNQTRVRDNRNNTGTNTNNKNDLIGQNNTDNNDWNGNNMLDNNLNDNLDNDLNNGMTRPNNLSNNLVGKNVNANDLARKISDLPEVDKASVVVTNDTVLVGANLRGNTQGTMTTDLRKKIENIVRDTNTNFSNISITTDPDLYDRIQTMSDNIGNGNPIEGFAEEIRDIIRNITPGTPNVR